MKKGAWLRILAVVLSGIMLVLGSGVGSYAYKMPSGYSFSNSYKSGEWYAKLAAVKLTGNQRVDIAAIAASQIGYHEGSSGDYSGYGTSEDNYAEYNRYAYSSNNAAWCGSFVSWCAAMAGIPTTILPKTAAAKPTYWKMCGTGALSGATCKTPENLVTNGGTYVPQVGDLVFFGSKSTGDPLKNSCSHVGLIIQVDLTYTSGKISQIVVHTAEGNYSNKVSNKKYTFNSEKRDGLAYKTTYLNTFAIPNYAKPGSDIESGTNEYASLDIGAYGGTYLRTTSPVCPEVRQLQQALNIVSIMNDKVSLPLLTVNGKFCNNTLSVVKSYQTSKGLKADGIVGKDTWNALRTDVINLTKAEKSDFVVSGGKLYAYKGTATTVTIPNTVVVIAEDAFRYREEVSSVSIPKTVTTIMDGAFAACYSLDSVNYAGTVDEYKNVEVQGSNASFKSATVTYKKVMVTFESNGVQKTVEIDAGTVPAVPAGISTVKPGDAMYNYTFAGWKCGGTVYQTLPKVTSDCTFVAEYTQTARSYTVTFEVNGVKKTVSVAAGSVPAVPAGLSTIKPSDAQYEYTFAGWKCNGVVYKTLPAITGNCTFVAEYTKSVRMYSVTFEVSGVKYTLSVAAGTVPTLPAELVTAKPSDAMYHYTFIGWKCAGKTYTTLPAVTGDSTFVAEYTKTLRSYNVTFESNGVTKTVKVTAGTVPALPAGISTVKPSDVMYDYTFIGWNRNGTSYKTLPTITSDSTFVAEFTQTKRVYTVTFRVDGIEQTVNVAAGEIATVPDGLSVIKPSDTIYDYAFAGWACNGQVYKDALPAITSDCTFDAEYILTKRQYSVVLGVDGVCRMIWVTAGETIALPSDMKLEKPGNALYEYVFTGWMCGNEIYAQLPEATCDCVLVAKFEKVERDLTTETIQSLLGALSHGADDITLYDFVQDGVLNIDDLNALLVLMASKG
ncbi:MAG: CHAP domain-containing protein [Ruminococcaceae bacterium]|nr:CHAP domain-containing protein [Oscillospiraceae bacterium]